MASVKALSMLQVQNCVCGFVYNDTTYEFSDFDVLNFTYNTRNRLTRGANGANKKGISYKEGVKTADALSITIMDCEVETYDLLLKLYEKEERILFFITDKETGKRMTMGDAIITDKPRQTTVGEGEESLTFTLNLESFNVGGI